MQAMRGAMIDKAAMQANLDAANKKWLQLDARAVQQDAEIEKLKAEHHDLTLLLAVERDTVADLKTQLKSSEIDAGRAEDGPPDPVETPFVPAGEEVPAT
jgi:multidrug resistance efflux pump